MLEQLKARVNKELEEFKQEWMEKSKEEIFDNAYKISIITDFEYLNFDDLEEEQIELLLEQDNIIEFLLEQDNIIEFLFEEWMDADGFNTFGVLDEFFRYVVNDRI